MARDDPDRRTRGPGGLAAIVAALGGDLYAGGRRASVPAPGHSAADRSVSLLLSDGRVVAHSFGAATWQEVLADLRARGLVDAAGAPLGGGPAAGDPCGPPPTALARQAAAERLWSEGGPLRPETAAARYCRRRGVEGPLEALSALRSHADAPVSVYRPGRGYLPALLAAVLDPTAVLTAVEVTYLAPNGLRSRLRVPRKTVGVLPPGSAVRLAEAMAEMLVAEGVFTTLSAMARFRLPGWALLSAVNVPRWRPPEGVRRVLIAADRGPAGEAAGESLRAALAAQGVTAAVRLPPPPHGDWNDAAQPGG